MPMPGPPAGLEEPKPLGMPMLGLPVRQQEPKPLGMPMLGLPVRQNTGTNMLRSGKVDRQEKDKISQTELQRREKIRALRIEEQDTLKTPSIANGYKLRAPQVAGQETQRTPSVANGHKLDNIGDLVTRPVLAVMAGRLSQIAPVQKSAGNSSSTNASDVSKAAGSAALVGFGNIAGNILKNVSGIMISRGFSSSLFGLYSSSFTVVTLIASIFQLGLDNAMIRYVAVYRNKQQANSLRGLMIFCTALSGVAGIVGALFLLFAAPYIALTIYGKARLLPLLLLMAPMIPLLCMQTIWFSGLQGFKAFKWRVLSERFLPPIGLILLLGAGIVLHYHSGFVALATLTSTLIGTMFGLYFLFRSVLRVAKPEPEQYQTREWVGFALPVFLSAITDILLDATDTLLQFFYRIAPVGLAEYNASIKVSTFVSMPLVSLNAIFAPTIAELHAKGEREKLAEMFKVITKWTITFSLPIFLLAALLSRSILHIWGDDLSVGWPLLVALSAGQMINAATGSVGYMLIMTGHQRVTFLNTLVALIVNAVVGVILTPRYGVIGTAISTGLAEIVVNLMRLLQVVILLRMQPYRWDCLKPLGAGLISTALGGVLLYFMRNTHPFLQFAIAPVFLISYIALLAVFKTSPEDKVVIDALRKKFIKGKK